MEADGAQAVDGPERLPAQLQVLGEQAGVVVALLELLELDRLIADDPMQAVDAATVGRVVAPNGSTTAQVPSLKLTNWQSSATGGRVPQPRRSVEGASEDRAAVGRRS